MLLPYYKLFLDKNLILAGGSISSIIYNHYCKPIKPITFNDIDFFYFKTKTNDNLKSILNYFHNYFKNIDLNFVCYGYFNSEYWLRSNRYVTEEGNERMIKSNKNLFIRNKGRVFNIILLDNNSYYKHNLPKEKGLFVCLKENPPICVDSEQNIRLYGEPSFSKMNKINSDVLGIFQFIELEYNYDPPNLEIATNVLLNNFDISLCQSAIYKKEKNIYSTKVYFIV